jgi:hypothetical protein
MHKGLIRFVLTFISIAILFNAQDCFATIEGDIELLKVVADGYEANLNRLITWRGQAQVTSSLSFGTGPEAIEKEVKYRAEFVLDRHLNAVRWKWFTIEEMDLKQGERINTSGDPIAGITRNDYSYVLFCYDYGSPSEERFLSVYTKDGYPVDSCCEPIRVLEQTWPTPIPERLRSYHKIAHSPEISPGTIVREGNIVTLEVRQQIDAGTIIERHVFDIGKGCSLMEYYNSSPQMSETRCTLDYEKVSDVWVMKRFSESYTGKSSKLSDVSKKTAEFTSVMVNEPLAQDEF